MSRQKSNVWDEVIALRDAGHDASISFPKAARVIVQQRRPPGRPRTKPLGAGGHYGWRLQTPGGRAMRCRAFGCTKDVKKHSDRITCSDACEEELRRYCEITLDVINRRIPVEDFPVEYRTGRGGPRRGRRKAA